MNNSNSNHWKRFCVPPLPIAGRREPRKVRSASTGMYVPKIGNGGTQKRFQWLLLSLLFFFSNAFAITSSQETRYLALTKEIRCVVCQNQNIADSDAPLANDLRKKIYAMVEDKKSDENIKDYLVARYGEFILLKPRFNYLTLVLWLFPFLALLTISYCFYVSLTRKS